MDVNFRPGYKNEIGQHLQQTADQQCRQRRFLHSGCLQDIIENAGKGDQYGYQSHHLQGWRYNSRFHLLAGV